MLNPFKKRPTPPPQNPEHNDTTLRIRRASQGDIESLCQLMQEGNDIHVAGAPTYFRAVNIKLVKEHIANLLANKNAHILVAQIGGNVVGYVQFSAANSSAHPYLVTRSYVSVAILIIQKQYRRQGIGKALMNEVNNWAQEHHMTNIELNVYELNPEAIAFYEALGYRTFSRQMKLKVG